MTGADNLRFAASLKRACAVMWQGLEYRIELMATEFRADRRRLIVLALLAQTALFTAFMTLICLNVLVLAVFWNTHRLAVSVILASAYLLVTVVLIVCIRWRLKTAPRPFQATLDELKRDRAALTGTSHERDRAPQADADSADRASS